MKILILSGGIGTGLWPLSREEYPKQFLDIVGGKSLLELTVERFLPAVFPEDIFIVTQKDKKFLIERELSRYGFQEAQIICEPFMRGTAFAIFLGVTYLREKIGIQDHESICVAPSDHYIGDGEAFCAVLQKLKNPPSGYYTLLGVPAESPNPGYGYISFLSSFIENKDDWKDFRRVYFVKTYTSFREYCVSLIFRRALKELVRMILDTKSSIVFFPMTHLWSAAVTASVKKASPKTKVVATLHDPILHPGEGNPWLWWLQHRLITKSDGLVILSDVYRSFLVQRYRLSNEKILTLPHGPFHDFRLKKG